MKISKYVKKREKLHKDSHPYKKESYNNREFKKFRKDRLFEYDDRQYIKDTPSM